MIRTLLLGLAVVIAADGASAQGRAVYGFSSTSCGEWLQARTAKNRAAFSCKHMWTAFCPDTILQPMILTFLRVCLTTRARAFTPG